MLLKSGVCLICTLFLGVSMKPNSLFTFVYALFFIFSTPQQLLAGEALDIKAREALAGSHRSEKNRSRDQYRNPIETLKFFGVTPEATVLEISPGRGWYTEVLAPIFRDSGVYYVATWDIPSLPENIQPYLEKLDQGYRGFIKENPGIYDQVRIITYNSKKPEFLAPEKFDFVMTFRNVHNWSKRGNDELMFMAFFNALKPGGILGVTDHRAKPGTPFDKQTESGYMTEKYVIDLANKVGFELVGKSDINSNPKDTADHPGGVWNLPPTLRNVASADKEKYIQIGESDRMTLKFVRPKN